MSVFKNDRLIRVLNYLPVDRIPVWMMRQAGRTDPEYNQLRKKDGRALEELFADPEIAIKISLLPKRLGVDAIIMFQDILTPLTPMGAEFHFAPGPILEKPVRTMAQVKALRLPEPETELRTVAQILSGLKDRTRRRIAGAWICRFTDVTGLVFDCGQAVQTVKLEEVLAFIKEQPEITQALLELLTTMTVDYLNLPNCFRSRCGSII